MPGIKLKDPVTNLADPIIAKAIDVNLFLQDRRLHDLYSFGIKADRWLPTSIASRKACFFPIAFIERQSNTLAPQLAIHRPPNCT